MAIPHRTTKFKPANILATTILGSTAKFNSHQYFRPYGMYCDKYQYESPYIIYYCEMSLYYLCVACRCSRKLLFYAPQDTPMTKVWYKQDDTFFVPRVCINLKISRYTLPSDIMHDITTP